MTINSEQLHPKSFCIYYKKGDLKAQLVKVQVTNARRLDSKVLYKKALTGHFLYVFVVLGLFVRLVQGLCVRVVQGLCVCVVQGMYVRVV